MERADTVGGAALVTILFTDIVASTEVLERLGDERAEQVRRDHFRLVRDAVGERGGNAVKTLGDGLMVVFSSALDALVAAQGIQRRSVGRQQSDEAEIRIRIGLHVGEPIRDEGDYFGRPVVLARRLCDAARPGTILASELVRDLIGTRGGIEFRKAGRRTLKGFSQPMQTYEIEWERNASTSGGAVHRDPRTIHLVGRVAQLGELERELDVATRGELRAVLLVGDGGVGKTRLMAELVRRHGDAIALGARIPARSDELHGPLGRGSGAIPPWSRPCPGRGSLRPRDRRPLRPPPQPR